MEEKLGRGMDGIGGTGIQPTAFFTVPHPVKASEVTRRAGSKKESLMKVDPTNATPSPDDKDAFATLQLKSPVSSVLVSVVFVFTPAEWRWQMKTRKLNVDDTSPARTDGF